MTAGPDGPVTQACQRGSSEIRHSVPDRTMAPMRPLAITAFHAFLGLLWLGVTGSPWAASAKYGRLGQGWHRGGSPSHRQRFPSGGKDGRAGAVAAQPANDHGGQQTKDRSPAGGFGAW